MGKEFRILEQKQKYRTEILFLNFIRKGSVRYFYEN